MMEDGESKKIYFSIKEVASRLCEKESTLRFWESEFPDVIAPRRNEHGVRFYTEEDIEAIQLIRNMIRNNGLTLEGVRKKLNNNRDAAVRQAKITAKLNEIKAELKDLAEVFDEAEKMYHSAMRETD